MLDRTKKDWWKSAVMYQIYPKSFQDTNGDGIGDLPGVTEHLDYLENLGVDGIWLSPVYPSPQKDNGYDVSDYSGIYAPFGTLADMDALIDAANKRGMVIIMDLVLNHSSSEHPWFIDAKSSKDSKYHDFYIWVDGEPNTPPNDLKATFGGPAWTYVPEIKQWYFHQFSPWQPDLNWENPEMRKALHDMIRGWIDRGIGGFRLDVIEMFGKDPMKKIGPNGPRLHEFVKELKTEAFKDDAIITVGETWSAGLEHGRMYTNPDGSELSMVFQFEPFALDYNPDQINFNGKWDLKPLSLTELKNTYERWQQGLFNQGWNSLFLENHDLPRIVSRWGNDKNYRVQSAKMLAAMIHGMQGTPWIYQGEEIGMTNVALPIEMYDDLETKDGYNELKNLGWEEERIMEVIHSRSRDNARTPMQWSDEKYAGFSTVKPWLPVNPNYTEINVKRELADKNSIFYFYKSLIELRKKYDVFLNGTFTLVDKENPYVFAYTRDTADEHMLVLCNFTDKNQSFQIPGAYNDAKLLLGNYNDASGDLKPYEARILYTGKK